jgi:hypothetical protein
MQILFVLGHPAQGSHEESRSARELEKFCGGSGSAWESTALALVSLDESD